MNQKRSVGLVAIGSFAFICVCSLLAAQHSAPQSVETKPDDIIILSEDCGKRGDYCRGAGELPPFLLPPDEEKIRLADEWIRANTIQGAIIDRFFGKEIEIGASVVAVPVINESGEAADTVFLAIRYYSGRLRAGPYLINPETNELMAH